MTRRPTVAVIGAGFSGLLTALHLLSGEPAPCVRLVERRPRFARGAAYSTGDAQHLLNVRASNMSAFPEQPDHFVRWLDATGHGGAGTRFVGRELYGGYLQALLRGAAERADAGRLILEADGACALARRGGRWRVDLELGRGFDADLVVLATGNPPPCKPPGFDDEAAAHPRYFADPWRFDHDRLPQRGGVLLLGTGLTMVDAAIAIARERPGVRMFALSRRGLLPRRHLEDGPKPAPFAEPPPGGPADLLAELRRRAAAADWRAGVDGLRPHVQATWRAWSLEHRRRFLRHLRPWWDVHRHRLAPEIAQRLDHLMASGALGVAAGRVHEARADGEGLEVDWSPRGAREPRRLKVDAVVNCTGPNGDLARATDSLLRGLSDAGWIRADACGLGLDVDAEGRLLGRDGRASPGLYGVGPLTRGAFWEITSVPDIRVQAAEVAARVRACAALSPAT